MTELLSADELAIAKRLAAGDQSAKADAEGIYLKHVAAYVDGGRKSVAMNFLSECFHVSPDFNLKALYRKRLLEQDTKIRDTEILLNLRTGEVRRNIVTPEQRFRYHEGFTKADEKAGWKQISTFSEGYDEEAIAAEIAQAKAIYLGQPN